MANEEHLAILKQGVDVWNAWVKERREKLLLFSADLDGAELSGTNLTMVDFRSADLQRADLGQADLRQANLRQAKLTEADITEADFRWADLGEVDLREANLSRAKFEYANFYRANLRGADLRGANLYLADMSQANLCETELLSADLFRANLSGSNLTRAKLDRANLSEADLRKANVGGASLARANLSHANLRGADLTEADLTGVNLQGTYMDDGIHITDKSRLTWEIVNQGAANRDLSGVDLSEAFLQGANFVGANLSRANLSGADLQAALLVETDLRQANLSNCRIFGASAWKLKLEGTHQENLVITPRDEPIITVDNLEVAQFIYLLINHQKLRTVLNSVMEKGVLLLGPFRDGGLERLQAMAAKLREMKYLPIIFDFDRPEGKTYTETVMTLMGLCRFVVVDVSGPSVPAELQATVPNFKIPFVPIIQAGKKPYSMLSDILEYPWVVRPPIEFVDQAHLIELMPSRIVTAAEEKHRQRQTLLDELFNR